MKRYPAFQYVNKESLVDNSKPLSLYFKYPLFKKLRK